MFEKKGVNAYALGGFIIVTKSDISAITSSTVPSRLLSRSLPEERGREITPPFLLSRCFAGVGKRESKLVLSILTFIMFFLRDTFSMCHGFQSTSSMWRMKYFKRCFPVLDRPRSHLEQTGYPHVCPPCRNTGMKKLNSERPTVRLGLTVIYFKTGNIIIIDP